MKIAIDLTSLADNFSGIERYAANVAKQLVALDRENSYSLVFKDAVHPFFYDLVPSDNISYIVEQSKGRGKFVFSQIVLPKVMKRIGPDLSLFLAFPAPLLHFSRSISTVHDLCCVDCPETMTTKSMLLWRVLDWKAAQSPLGMLTISDFSKSRIIEHYKVRPEKVPVVYCGIDDDLFSSSNASASAIRYVKEKYDLPERFVLSLSTIEPRKNLPFLIEAWSSLRERELIDCDLVLAGRRGWKTDALLEGLSPALRSSVHFTGFVEDGDLPALYCSSDLFVFPSIYEGFGLPPVEASYCGAKVLCSDIPCLTEVCGDGVWYYRSASQDSLQGQIRSCLMTDEQKVIKKKYKWQFEARKLLGYLRGLEI